VQRGPQGTFVFTVKPDKTVEVRAVAISLTQNNISSIASGIAAGDLVVVDGQDKLQAGSHVEPRAPTGGGNRTAQTATPGAS
jgi:membrane fusion protein, multidrug efflux system